MLQFVGKTKNVFRDYLFENVPVCDNDSYYQTET